MSGSRPMPLALCALLFVAALAGCNGSGGAGLVFDAAPAAAFIPSGSPPTENQVRLVGRSTGRDEVTVDVVVAGPTDSDDIFGFFFGLEIDDPSVAAFVSGSQQIGPALDTTGCGNPFLIITSPASHPGLLTVSLTKLAPCTGNEISAGEETIISLAFRVEPEGSTTIRLSGQSPTGDPFASDSRAATIDSVTFDPGLALFSGR